MMNKKAYLLFLSLLALLASCTKDKMPELPVIMASYMHIAHTRTNSNPAMDSTVENLDYSKFDMLWLGGDLAHLTSEDDHTMSHVDSIFDIGNKNTLWALGNHDYSDLDKIEEFTNRAPYYTYHKNGITFLVLDTQDSLSSIVGWQKELFDSVIDTIQESSHLVILHHKLIWMYNNPSLESQIGSVANGGFGGCFFCINPNNFYTVIYPKLLEVKQRGIEVICIGGDIGFKVNEFEYSQDGIHFLASGINSGFSNNKALLFHHDISNKLLTWEFELLTNL